MSDAPLDPPSINIVYDAIKGRIAEQDARLSLLEGKAVRTLGSASILTSGVGLLTAGLATFKGTNPKPEPKVDLPVFGNTTATEVATVIIIAIFLAYFFVVFTTYQATKTHDYKVTGDPNALMANYLVRKEEDTKQALSNSMVRSFNNNEKILATKADWTDWAIKAIGLQALLSLAVGSVQLWIV